jgi:hypothetical protein
MQVQICKNEMGQVVVPSNNNPEYGYVRVETTSQSFVNGWLRNEKRSALIKGFVKDLTALEKMTTLPGKIVIKETTEPAYDGQKPKINPSTQEVIKHGGKPIYRNSMFTQNMQEFDIILEADKVKQSNVVMLSTDNLDNVPF